MRWIAPVRFFNGGNSEANANEAAQTNFYNTLTKAYSADYGQFQTLTNSLMQTIQPIVNAGPSQYGFSTAEDASLRSTAENADAAATQNAKVAANQQITAANGGAAELPTGAAEQLTEEADVSGAQKLASDEQTITQAGYNQGNQNYQTALGQEDSVMGAMNPNAYAGAATSGGSAATGAVNAATEADDGWMNMVGSALGGAVGGWASGGFKTPCWIAAELYGGWDDLRTILVRAWLGIVFQNTWYGKIIINLYAHFGERLAAYIKTGHPRTRWVFQKIFDKALHRAEEWFEG